jgi:preprotein translocase subunit SecG
MEAVWAALLFFDAGRGKRFPLFEKNLLAWSITSWRGQNCKKALHSGEKCAIIFFTCKGRVRPSDLFFRKDGAVMPIYELILSIVYVILALFLIVVVILQSGKSSGLSGAIGGGSGDTFLAKNKSKSMDARLAKMTKWVAIVFMVLTLVMCFIV